MKKILIISHSNIDSNSGYHIQSISQRLSDLGIKVTICVPLLEKNCKLSDGVNVTSFNNYLSNNKYNPDLIHCWTPREKIRIFYNKIVSIYGRFQPYIIHLEDDEEEIFRSNMGFDINNYQEFKRNIPENTIHPEKYLAFINGASAITTLSKNITANIPRGKPVLEFWPGCDDIFLKKYSQEEIDTIFRKYNINKSGLIIVYNGNTHASNVKEVTSLYIAVSLLKRSGYKITFVRTGKDYILLDQVGNDILKKDTYELGFIDRNEIPLLLQGADILVQPGNPDKWNVGRFPSKIPEFLASSRTVVLPKVNIGCHIPNNAAVIIPKADASGIFYAIKSFIENNEKYSSMGLYARNYYDQNLDWSISTRNILKFYEDTYNSHYN
jgi:glycosyltransferase involved in cell wall biosynthesis